MTQASASAAYRQLLRTIKTRIDPRQASFLRQEARQLFRSRSVALTDDSQRLLEDYSFLVSSVHEYKDLLTSYNIGIDRQVRQREDIGKSAARAGLQLPQHWDERMAYEKLQERLKKP